MDKTTFVQNIKFYCERKGIKPTNACRESGAGASLISNVETRGQVPSVEKVQLLARYLGVTTSELLGELPRCETAAVPVPGSGTGPPEVATLHDSSVRLKVAEVEMIMAYRCASEDEKTAIRLILKKYKKKTPGMCSSSMM